MQGWGWGWAQGRCSGCVGGNWGERAARLGLVLTLMLMPSKKWGWELGGGGHILPQTCTRALCWCRRVLQLSPSSLPSAEPPKALLFTQTPQETSSPAAGQAASPQMSPGNGTGALPEPKEPLGGCLVLLGACSTVLRSCAGG